MAAITKDTLFTAKPSPASKAEATTRAAAAIIGAETNAREKKTERLRELRLAREAEETAAAPVKAPGAKTAGRKVPAKKR